jgi:uncharacterized protein (DUF305 family)
MDRKTIGVAMATLIIGAISGYAIDLPPERTHVMPDGSAMSNEMGDMLAGLEGKSGDALDRAFLEEMIVHHEGAVAMAKVLLASTQRPELLELGNDIVSAQTREIGMMRGWLREWF